MAALPPNNPPPYLPPNDPTPPQRGGVLLPPFGPVSAISQQQVDISNALRQNFEALSSLSTQISRNLGGTSDLLGRSSDHMDSMVNNSRRLIASTRQEAEQQKQMSDYAQARKDAMAQVQEAEGKIRQDGAKSLSQQLQLAGMLDRRGNIRYLDENAKPQTVALNQLGSLPAGQRQQVREQLANQLALHGKEETASVNQIVQALAHGNIGSAIGELMQSFPATAGLAARVRTTGAGMEAAGLARGGAGGLLQRGAGMALAEGGGFLLSPAAAIVAVRELRQGIRTYQADLQQGMQGGLQGGAAARETAGAALRARFEGLNPFDALTTRMAEEIQRGIQSEGFTGRLRAAWQDSVTDIVKSTGMDAGTALQLMTTSANQLGESATQFRQDMNLVENAAKNTNFSVTQLAQNMQQLQQSFAQGGGVQAAQPVAQLANTLQNALGGTGAGRAALPGLTQAVAQPQTWQRAVALAGINPLLANSEATLRQAPRILDELGKRMWQYKNQGAGRTMNLHDWVVQMYAAGLFAQLLPGADEVAVEEFMRITGHGGLETTQRRHEAENVRARSQTVHRHHSFLGIVGREIVGGASRGMDAAARAGDYFVNQSTGSHTHAARNLVRALDRQGPISDDIDIAATRRNFINAERAQLSDLNPRQREQVLAPIRQAQTYSELVAATDTAQQIHIKLNPEAARYFATDPSNVITYNQSLRGRAGRQYSVAPPHPQVSK